VLFRSYKSPYIVYGEASVYQVRNEHDILDDFNKEIYSYMFGTVFLRAEHKLPDIAKKSYDLYREEFVRL